MRVRSCRPALLQGQETAILCAAVQQHGRDAILDLRKVDAIDAAGVGLWFRGKLLVFT